MGIDEGNKSQKTKDRDKRDKHLGEDLKGVQLRIVYILKSNDEGYKKHGKKQKQGIKFVKAKEKDRHEPYINLTCPYLKGKDVIHMIVHYIASPRQKRWWRQRYKVRL